MARGANALAVIFIFGLVITMFSSLGYYSAAGVNVDNSLNDDVEKVERDVSSEREAQGGGNEGFLGFTVSQVGILSVGWRLITGLDDALVSFFGIPPAIAGALGSIVVLAFGMFLTMVIRGLVWES